MVSVAHSQFRITIAVVSAGVKRLAKLGLVKGAPGMAALDMNSAEDSVVNHTREVVPGMVICGMEVRSPFELCHTQLSWGIQGHTRLLHCSELSGHMALAKSKATEAVTTVSLSNYFLLYSVCMPMADMQPCIGLYLV